MKKTSASRYLGNRKPVNLVLDHEVVEAARQYLLKTKRWSVSVYVERQLCSMLRRAGDRAKGIKIPAIVFE